MAGLIVYLATYLLALALSFRPFSPGSFPLCIFILWAVCQVRMMTSPTRPIACESEESMLKAPMSWSTSSAAIVSALILESAKATSSGMRGSR